MTRENKLALVVGFGLILFVGILISDHFSIVRNQQVADLTSVVLPDTYVSKVNDSKLIDLTPRRPAPQATPAVATVEMNNGVQPMEQARPEQRTTINPNGLANDNRIVMQPGGEVPLTGFVPAPAEPPAIQVRFHDVRTGETLYAICRQ
jgi:hypothetical protein